MTNKRCHSVAFCDQMQTGVDVSTGYHNHSSGRGDTHTEASVSKQISLFKTEVNRLKHALGEAEEREDRWEQETKDLQGQIQRLKNALSRVEKREDVIYKNAQRRIDKLIVPCNERKLELDKALRELSMQTTAHEAALQEQKAAHEAALQEQKAAHEAALQEQKAAYEAAPQEQKTNHVPQKLCSLCSNHSSNGLFCNKCLAIVTTSKVVIINNVQHYLFYSCFIMNVPL